MTARMDTCLGRKMDLMRVSLSGCQMDVKGASHRVGLMAVDWVHEMVG